MSDEVTISMARDVAIGLNKLSEGLRKEDPHGYIAGIGLMFVSVVEQRDALRARVAELTAERGRLAAQLQAARDKGARCLEVGCLGPDVSDPVPASQDDARDAERYRFLRDNPFHWLPSASLWVIAEEGGTIRSIGKAESREQAIDAAILAAKGGA